MVGAAVVVVVVVSSLLGQPRRPPPRRPPHLVVVVAGAAVVVVVVVSSLLEQPRRPPPSRPPHLVVVGVVVVVVVSAAGKNRENKVWRSPSFSSSVGGAAVVVVAPNRPAMPSRTGLGLGVVVMPSISWIFPTRIPIAMSPTRPLSSTSDTGEHVTMPQKQKKNRARIIFVQKLVSDPLAF